MSDSLIDGVAKWLATQGYPLEMEIAHLASSAGFEVSQSDYYKDPEDEKFREIDLVLSRQRHVDNFHLGYHLLVECKSGKEKPWLVLSTPNHLLGTETAPRRDPGMRHFTVHGSFIANEYGDDLLLHATFDSLDRIFPRLSIDPTLGYGITEAHGKGNEIPFQAVVGATKAAFSYAERLGGVGLSVPFIFTIPLVITEAPLLSVVYDPGSPTLQISPIQRGLILWKPVVAGRSRMAVYVVQRAHAQAFLEQCRLSADWWLNHPAELLKELHDKRLGNVRA